MVADRPRYMGCLTLLFMRQDLPRREAMDYWRGPHAQFVARAGGRWEYRQHHFGESVEGWWPAPAGVETTPPADRRVDGIPEVTFLSAADAAQGQAVEPLIHADEANVFRRTLLYLTAEGATIWWRSTEEPLERTVVLLRRADACAPDDFAAFMERLGERLALQPSLQEVRTLPLFPWEWDTPGVAHDNPDDQQFHGALIVGARSHEELRAAVSAATHGLDEVQQTSLKAAHAYDVARTLVYRREGRPTLPQWTSTPADIITKPPLDPQPRTFPPLPARSAQSHSPTAFPAHELVPLPHGGAEDVIVDGNGDLLVGATGGAIVRIDPDSGTQSVVADTGGRPLGLELLADGRVLVCDAHRGLLRVDAQTGRVESLVQYVAGVPLRFCSNAAAEDDGTIWFTESTSRFDFEHYLGSMLEHRPSGRLFRRDPNGEVQVVLQDLHFPNGVTLVPDGSALLLAETAAARLTRIPLSGPDAGRPRIVAELPALPDNLSRFTGGRTWAGMPGPRAAALESLGGMPAHVAVSVWDAPEKPPSGGGTTWLMAFDADGQVVADLQTPDAPVRTVTGAVEHDGELFCVNVHDDAMLRVHLSEV